MIDASQGFMKDGPKNRLRSQDIHKIVDAFTKGTELSGFSRMVPFAEIEKNEFNLNLPRYIDSQKLEDRQDIEGHLRGGIPQADIDALQSYWVVCPSLRNALFKECRPDYVNLVIDKTAIKQTIYEHPEFVSFTETMNAHFNKWRTRSAEKLKALDVGCNPKQVIFDLSEDLLAHYADKPLIDKYDVYQHLMDYWAEVMQDDCYLISADGWKAETYRIIEKDKKGKEKDKGWTCDLVPKEQIVGRYYVKEQDNIDDLTVKLETISSRLSELEEEHGSEEGVFTEFDKVNKGNVTARLKEIKDNKDASDEASILNEWLKLSSEESNVKKELKEADVALDLAAYEQYPKLSKPEIKTLVVDDKWLTTLDIDILREMDRVTHDLTHRVLMLAERYEFTMPILVDRCADFDAKVNAHLEQMGFAW